MIKREKLHLTQIMESSQNALIFVEGYSKADFLGDSKTQHAVAMALISIGESAKRLLEKHPDFTAQHEEIKWDKICGQRNRIAHGYHEIDWGVVWDTVTEDLGELACKIELILKDY